jgi:hypothetical protein
MLENARILSVNSEYNISVRTSQETHYVSATKPNRLMLFRETVAVYCENHTEHVDTLCGQNARVHVCLKQAVRIVTTVLQRPTHSNGFFFVCRSHKSDKKLWNLQVQQVVLVVCTANGTRLVSVTTHSVGWYGD